MASYGKTSIVTQVTTSGRPIVGQGQSGHDWLRLATTRRVVDKVNQLKRVD